MLSVIIKNDGEPNVVELTYENIWHEVKDIPDSEVIISDHWFDELDTIKNHYVCLLESDCLVAPGYFKSQMDIFKENPYFRKMAVLGSSTAVDKWDNIFYGYSIDDVRNHQIVKPNMKKKAKIPFATQIAYIPGAIIRVSMLRDLLKNTPSYNDTWEKDLVYLSTKLSLGFWGQGDGNRVYINPNTSYVTTETYVNDLGSFDFDYDNLEEIFKRESI